MVGISMTQGAPWKHIIKFALPVLLGNLLQQLYNTVDAIVVGNFAGEDALSAVGTTGTFTFLFLALAIGFSAGSGIVVAQHYGAGDMKQVRANASVGIILLMVMGIIATIVGLIIAKPAFTYFINVPKDILNMSLQYFMIFSAGLVFSYGYNIFAAVLRAVGDSRAMLYFLMVSSGMNIVLDLLFVAVFNWSVAGAAIATVISQAASFFAAYFYMTRKYPVFRFKPKELIWDGKLAKKTIIVGLPMAIQQLVVSMGLTAIQRAVNYFGKVMTASCTVGARIEMYLFIPCLSFQTTLATYTGQNIGAGQMDRVKKGARQAVAMSAIITACTSACVFIFAENIAGLFGVSHQALVYATMHLRIVAIATMILAIYFPLFGVFQGANHPRVPMFAVITALIIRVTITYIFYKGDFFGYRIIWLNCFFGFSAAFVIALSYYLSKKWMKNSSLRV